jgi:hypothetical protein
MISLKPLRSLLRRRAYCHCQDEDVHAKIRAIKAREQAERLADELLTLDSLKERRP